jgi:hypothetical protein
MARPIRKSTHKAVGSADCRDQRGGIQSTGSRNSHQATRRLFVCAPNRQAPSQGIEHLRTARHVQIGPTIALPVRHGHRAVMVENENPNGGRKIALLPRSIKRSDEIRSRHLSTARDLLEARPEVVLKADARLVTAYHDGSLFHC